MNPLWRSLFRAVAARFARRDTGAAGTPPPGTPAPTPADSGTVPPGVFDRRPAVMQSTPDGVFCLPADYAGDAAARAITELRPLAAELAELARAQVVPGTVVIDVGAGFGRTATLFSRAAGPGGQVLAFEADEYLCDVLQQTIRYNRYENLRLFHGAVYDQSCTTLDLPAVPAGTDAAYSGRCVEPSRGNAGGVPARTIDQFAITAPVSLLHIDTNGCELQVLRGAVETLARHRMPVAFRFDPVLAKRFGTTLQALQAFFEPLGYRLGEAAGGTLRIAQHQDPFGATATHGSAAATARPALRVPDPPDAGLCKLLRNRVQVDACSGYLKQWGYVPHNISCKDWDLAHIIPAIGDGNFLDMGSSDSYILKNLALKRIRGDLYGIDLRAPDVPVSNVNYLIGDLMRTPLPDGHFANITCLSVLEHQVDYDRFAAEASRLLAPGGRVFVTFDYWEPKVTPPIKLYGLDWMPLDAAMVRQFIASCARHGLEIVEPFDFTAGEPLIRWGYYSPHPDIRYTFGMAVFRKR